MRIYLFLAEILQEINRLAELGHYDSILQDCRSNRLPIKMITPTTLRNEIIKLNQTLNVLGSMTIINDDDISSYYHHPLTTCFVNAKDKLITAIIHVPIKNIYDRYSLYEGITIPFFL